MKKQIKNLTFLVIFLLSIVHATWGQSPNIVFILVDDLGYADVGYNAELNGIEADIATPNIDKLASNGTTFTSAYVAHPFCGPSRAGIMTGRYPHEICAQYNLSDSEKVLGVDTKETFFSNILQDAGYNTGIIGKWHLGQSEPHHPNTRGFDYFYGMLTGGHKYFTSDYLSNYANGNTWAYNFPLRKNGELANEPEGAYITDLFTDQGIQFIKAAEADDDKPFFLFMSYNAPHSPLEAKKEDKDILVNPPYSFKYNSPERHEYAAMVYSVDRAVKNLVDALTETKEIDNTLIVFLSDNGGRTDKIGSALNTPLRGAKGDTYEGGFRVPMFMHWPKQVPSGATYNYPVSALDLYPTFVALAGGKIPEGKEIDGKNILPNIKNNTNARAGEPIFSIRHKAAVNNVGVRKDQWKAYTTGNGIWRLFDVSNDISETEDVSAQNEAILNSMIQDANDWSKTHKTPCFFDNKSAEEHWNKNNMPNFKKTFNKK